MKMGKMFRGSEPRRRIGRELGWLLLKTAGQFNPGLVWALQVAGLGEGFTHFLFSLNIGLKESASLSPGSHLQTCKRKSTFLRKNVCS